jgi:hypothetical protein
LCGVHSWWQKDFHLSAAITSITAGSELILISRPACTAGLCSTGGACTQNALAVADETMTHSTNMHSIGVHNVDVSMGAETCLSMGAETCLSNTPCLV